MDEEVVIELIQDECTSKRIREELEKILKTGHRNTLLEKYALLEEQLGGIGASEKTAALIVNDLN
jgi:lipid-A-disaccharide synthase